MDGARILLVEDDEALCDLERRNLQIRTHDVSVAVDAKSALAYLRAEVFDLIILDINLPDLTGWEVLRTALNEGRLQVLNVEGLGPRLPVVVLSAVRVSQRRLAEFRPLAYLPKPFPMDALLRLAEEAARRRYTGAGYELGMAEMANMTDMEHSLSDEEELHA